MSWPRYLFVFFLAALAVLLPGGIINYFVDVQSIYHRDAVDAYANQYVHQLLTSRFGMVWKGGNERAIKLRLAELSDADCYVIGSSREMQIDSETMPTLLRDCRKVTNLAVPKGSFEDFVAAAGKLAKNAHARHLYVGIQAWGLLRNANSNWTEQNAALFAAQKDLGFAQDEGVDQTSLLSKIDNLFNAEYLLSNLAALRHHDMASASVPAIVELDDGWENLNKENNILFPDGRLRYSQQRIAQLLASAIGDGSDNIPVARNPVDARVVTQYGAVAKALSQQGIQVHYLLMPYHPTVLDCASARVCKTLSAVDAAIRLQAAELGVEVVGSFDPRPLGLKAQDFQDSLHLQPEALDKVAGGAK